MRKAMICVTAMLVLLQFWPMVFGTRTVADVATPGAQAAVVIAVPKRTPAVAQAVSPHPIKASVSKGALIKSCYEEYSVRYAKCEAGDRACGLKTADQWDLCEATGFWPQ